MLGRVIAAPPDGSAVVSWPVWVIPLSHSDGVEVSPEPVIAGKE